jgi:hypothetical protein
MSVVTVVNLTIEKGTDFEASFYLTGDDGGMLNLAETTAVSNLKKHPKSLKSYPFVVGISTDDGEVNISMGKTMTSVLPSGRTYFDVFLINESVIPSITIRVVTGSIIVEDTTLA